MTALTPSERVARSRERAIANGARRLNAILPPETAELLDTLVQHHGTITEALVRSIAREAAELEIQRKAAGLARFGGAMMQRYLDHPEQVITPR